MEKRHKLIKKIGSSMGIIITVEERNIYGLKVGDTVEMNLKKVEDT